VVSSPELLYTQQVRVYLKELDRGDVAAICALFAPDAQIFSPFLGWMQAAPFFAKVSEASGNSTITHIDICLSTTGARRATGYFIYGWVLKDGSTASFECVDVFEFDADGLIERMIIVYDTYPIRSAVGDITRSLPTSRLLGHCLWSTAELCALPCKCHGIPHL
jgi:hypothetical protein